MSRSHGVGKCESVLVLILGNGRMSWQAQAMLRAAVFTVLLTVSGVSGLLEDIIVTPLSYAEVDAGDFLTFNVVAGSQAGR